MKHPAAPLLVLAVVAAAIVVAPAAAAAASTSSSSTPAHGSKNSKGKVALPVCAAGANTATTTYSCNTYGQSVCNIATGQCDLATNTNLAKVAERTDCDFLASPADKGGCGLVTREELSQFQSEVVDVTNALAQESVATQAAISAIASSLTQMASQLVPNQPTPPPTSDDPLCKRVLTYNGAPRHPPFFTTGYTYFNIVSTTGGKVACNDAALAAFDAAVVAEAAKPDTCPLVPKTGGGEYPRIRARDSVCMDMSPTGVPAGKSLWFRLTLSWETRFPCPAAPYGRTTSSGVKGSEIFDLSGGCEVSNGCNPCKPATAGGPSTEAICQAIYSAYPQGTVKVVASNTYLLRESWCGACVEAGDPYCTPDNSNPYFV